MSKTNLIVGGIALVTVAFLTGWVFFGNGENESIESNQTGLNSTNNLSVESPPQTFTSTDAEEEGYWYSRYNLGSLVMRSSMGKIATPSKEMMVQAMAMADKDFDPVQMKAGNKQYGDGDHVIPPQNPSILSTIYRSGNPRYITKFVASDLGTQKWDTTKMDKSLTGLANGFTIMKEVEWARQFHVDAHFGTPSAKFGAQWRFVGSIMALSAKMQTKSFLENMPKYDLSQGGDAVMLMALSDLTDLLSTKKLANSNVPNRYRDPAMAQMVEKGANKLFNIVNKKNPSSIKANSLAIQSLVWYAAKTNNVANKTAALNKVTKLTKTLEKLSPKNASEKAYYLRGLIDAKRTLGLDNGSITTVGESFLADFDMNKGGFKSQNKYSIDDIGTIIGTLNALRIFESANIDTALAEDIFKTFFEEVINKSGLQISTPPLSVGKSLFEYKGKPETYFRYNAQQPLPPVAGGKFGTAPVFATSVEYKNNQWQVVNTNFDTAGAMHASNEMIWLHYDEINGFPEVNLSDILK